VDLRQFLVGFGGEAANITQTCYSISMTLTLLFPAALWLLLLLPFLWGFAWATRAVAMPRLGRGRYLALIVLRSLMVLCLILAFAGAQLGRNVRDTAVVFLLDGSDSLSPALREEALAYVNAAMASANPQDRAALVVFGASAAVERAMNTPAPINRLTSVVTTSRTNLAEAIQLGLALLPGDAQKRLVLLSDGGENSGRAADAARLAAVRGIPLDVVPLVGTAGADALIAALELPATAREGQDLPAQVLITSSVAGAAELELFADGDLIRSVTLDLNAGDNRFDLTLPAGEPGFRRVEVRLSAPFDTQPLNNRAAAFTTVQGPPHILLIAPVAEHAAPLQRALTATGLRTTLLAPEQTPSDPVDLQRYAAVALVDVPARRIAPASQRALATYVREQGGGLLMIGGATSFGAGGWRRSPLAPILPVELDPPNRQDRPDLGLAVVIDRSGSMAETVSGGRNRLDLAKEAVYQAALGLSERDQLGIFVFDEFAQTILPMQPLPSLIDLESALSRITLGGGTNIRSGIAEAATAMTAVDARVRHVILLTDGIADSNYNDLVQAMRAEQITISVVAIGSDANPNLRTIANTGGGAFYSVTSVAEVPQIFLEETVRVARRDIVELAFTPALALDAPPVRGLGPLPLLRGYNATGFRPTARTLLTAPDPEVPGERVPLLAVQQVGLGRTLAWTSDLKSQWAGDWLGWEPFVRFATGLVDVTLPPLATDQLSLAAQVDQDQAQFLLTVTTPDGRPRTAGALEARLLDPAGAASNLSFTAIGLGQYRAVATVDQPGVYLAQIGVFAPDASAIGQVNSGVVVSYSPEYGPRSSNSGLLTELASLTSGRIIPPPDTIFTAPGQVVGQVQEIALPLLWLVLVLLPFDIALRRLFLRNVTLPRPNLRPAAQPAPEPDPALARLQAARNRTRRQVISPAAPDAEPLHPNPSPVVTPPTAPTSAPSSAPVSEDRIASLLARKRRREE
jgi:uncharacterized membrane protein